LCFFAIRGPDAGRGLRPRPQPYFLRLNLVGPEKLPGSYCIDSN
jgi:hypothetical protein